MVELVEFYFDMYEIFTEIKKYLQSSLIEISVKQHQITFIFEKEILPLKTLYLVHDWIYTDLETDQAYLTSLNDIPMVVIPDLYFNQGELSENENHSSLISMLYMISIVADKICKCPALEIAFSDQYLKCYLDKPGLTMNDLENYQKMFGPNPTLELQVQRPYLLFINENMDVGDLYDDDN